MYVVNILVFFVYVLNLILLINIGIWIIRNKENKMRIYLRFKLYYILKEVGDREFDMIFVLFWDIM